MGFQCTQVQDSGGRLKAGAAPWRVIPLQVHPRWKNHSWVGSAVDCLSAKTDRRWNYFKCCVRIWRMFETLSTAILGIKGCYQGEKLYFIHSEHFDDRDSSNNPQDIWYGSPHSGGDNQYLELQILSKLPQELNLCDCCLPLVFSILRSCF